jgi:hypothetical protein
MFKWFLIVMCIWVLASCSTYSVAERRASDQDVPSPVTQGLPCLFFKW